MGIGQLFMVSSQSDSNLIRALRGGASIGMKLRRTLKALPVCVVLFGGQTPALAHHSYAMFDHARLDQYKAIVRIWEFTNPHAYLWVYINDSHGTPQLWGLEAPGPEQLVRSGWGKNTVSPGDTVTIKINPLRDGRKGGNLVSITTADGRSISTGGLPGAPGAPGALNNGPGR